MSVTKIKTKSRDANNHVSHPCLMEVEGTGFSQVV
jgi:hypothetical protein